MLHLLPEQQKNKVLKEYRKRLFVTACFAVFYSAIIGAILLIPSYLYSQIRFNEITSVKESLDANISAQQGDKTADIVKNINEDIAALQPIGGVQLPSDVFNRLSADQTTGITFSHYTYTLNADTSMNAFVAGVADTRDDLTNFVQTLEQDGYFEGAKVPLSSYTKETNIQFSFSLNVKGNMASSSTVTSTQ